MRLLLWRKRMVPPTAELSALAAAGFGYLETDVLVNNWGPTVLAHVGKYVSAIETGESDDWCRCQWALHPDGVKGANGKVLKRRIDTSFECPVHTKEGFLLGFLDWMKTHAA